MSVSHMKLSQIGTGEISSLTGKTRNLNIGFEWDPEYCFETEDEQCISEVKTKYEFI